MMRMAQQTLGNQAVQRLMRQSSASSVPTHTTARPKSIQRVAAVQQRTGQRVMQRGIFSWIKNKFKGWVKNQATEATFGTDAERQSSPATGYLDVMDQNKASFSDIRQIEVKSGNERAGEHKLKGRHYIAKDNTKGAYAGKTILFLSGSGGNAEDYSKDSAIYYCKEGANVLAVNYRGFGRSTTSDDNGKDRKMGHNELTDTMLYEDARAMFKWLMDNGVDAGNVIVQGYSLGGAMAANLVSTLANEGIRVGGLVFQSAIDSARSVAVRSQGSFLGGIGADNLGSDFDTVGAMKALAESHPDMKDLPIGIFSGTKEGGDHLGDDSTNLSTQLGDMGFNNVNTQTRSDRSHAPNHLESRAINSMIKNLFGPKAKPKEKKPVEDVVKVV